VVMKWSSVTRLRSTFLPPYGEPGESTAMTRSGTITPRMFDHMFEYKPPSDTVSALK